MDSICQWKREDWEDLTEEVEYLLIFETNGDLNWQEKMEGRVDSAQRKKKCCGS